MFDNSNNYKLKHEYSEGKNYYYIAFQDVQGVFHNVEVTKEVYLEFCSFVRIERNMRRSDERHEEHLDQSEEDINKKAIAHRKTVEEIVIERELLALYRLALKALPEKQRRRFLLHYEYGLTYEKIADLEQCKRPAVFKSIAAATKKIKIFLKLG